MGLTGRTYGIFTPEEIAAQEQTNNLYQAIGILLKLQAMFYRNREQVVEKPQEIKDDEDNEDNLKKNRGEATKKRGNNCVITEHEAIPFENVLEERYKSSGLSCGVNLFAQAEQSEINEMLNEVSSLSKPSYYAKHEIYLKACEYLEYLKGGTYGKEQTESKPSSTGKKGRLPRVNKPFRDFFSCTEEEYQQIIKLLKERHIEGSAAAIGAVISALKEKKYFIYDEDNDGAKLHEAIGTILGNVSEYRNFLIQIKKNPDEKIKKLLP